MCVISNISRQNCPKGRAGIKCLWVIPCVGINTITFDANRNISEIDRFCDYDWVKIEFEKDTAFFNQEKTRVKNNVNIVQSIQIIEPVMRSEVKNALEDLNGCCCLNVVVLDNTGRYHYSGITYNSETGEWQHEGMETGDGSGNTGSDPTSDSNEYIENIVANTGWYAPFLTGSPDDITICTDAPTPSVDISNEAIQTTYTVELYEPNTSNQNVTEIYDRPDFHSKGFRVRKVVEASDSYGTDVTEDVATDLEARERLFYTSTVNLQTGGFVRKIRVWDDTGNPTDLDVDPNTTSFLTCSGAGCGGTVNSSDLVWNGNQSVFEVALRSVLKNALWTTFGAIENINYWINTLDIGSGGLLNIAFRALHQDNENIIGFKKGESNYVEVDENGSSTITVDNSVAATKSASVGIMNFDTPCGQGSRNYNLQSTSINTASSDYNVLEANGVTVGLIAQSYTPIQCTSQALTASETNCTNPVFSWDYNDGNGFVSLGNNTNTQLARNTGTYRVTVTCNEGTVTDTYVL